MSSESRDSMVRSAAALIGSRGVTGTSFSDVLADSGAPRGSIYHHFPDGKRQLAGDAIDFTSELVLAHLRAGTGTTPAQVLGHFISLWRQSVLTSGGTSGCAVAGVALDTTPAEDALLAAARLAFGSWAGLLGEQLQAAGLPAERAAAVSVTALAAMEGALILCRVERDVGPLDRVAGELLRLVEPGIGEMRPGFTVPGQG